MSVVLQTDERSGPETLLPEKNASLTTRTDQETREADPRAEKLKDRWAPQGYFWAFNSKTGAYYLRPAEWMVKNVAAEADSVLQDAIRRYTGSEECKTLAKVGGAELRAYLQTRRAINDKAYARKLKQECDDAAYQMVQAAKYKLDAIDRMRDLKEKGRSIDNDERIGNLKNWAKNSQREAHILTQLILTAAEDEVPTFDYANAAQRVCDWSAYRLTETLNKKIKAEGEQEKLSEEAAEQEMQQFFD